MKFLKPLLFLLVLVCLCLTGCTDDDDDEDRSETDAETHFRVFHSSPDTGPIDVFLDGISVARSLSFSQVSRYDLVRDGSRRVRIESASTGAVLIDRLLELDKDTFFTLFVTNYQRVIDSRLIEDRDASVSFGEFRIRLFHAVPDSAGVDLFVVRDFNDIESEDPDVADLRFEEVSDYITKGDGTREVVVVRQGTISVEAESGPFRFDDEVRYTAVFLERRGGGRPLSLVILTDRDDSPDIDDDDDDDDNN